MRAIAVVAYALIASAAHAAEWSPTKSIRFIVGNPPGGATDLVGRILQPKLTAALGKQVVIDNRAGANGIISLELLKHAEPDGHTVGLGHIGLLIVSPAIQKVPFEPHKDFAPIGLMVSLQNIIITHPSVAAKSFNEYINSISGLIITRGAWLLLTHHGNGYKECRYAHRGFRKKHTESIVFVCVALPSRCDY